MVATYQISVTIIVSLSDYISAGNQFQRLKYSILIYEELHYYGNYIIDWHKENIFQNKKRKSILPVVPSAAGTYNCNSIIHDS